VKYDSSIKYRGGKPFRMKVNLKLKNGEMNGEAPAIYLIFLFLYAFVLMLFFTESSPLYLINEWVDPNAFFTVGKGMAHGLVPYRDLFEQKGPLLYALHALAYTVSHQTFFGVYILESLAMFVNLYFTYKISRLYLNQLASVLISIIFPIFILNHNSFRFGDSAEEFSIPFLIVFFYLVLNQFHDNRFFSFSKMFYFLNGIMVGCVFWIKFTLIGAWLGFYFALLIFSLLFKNWKNLILVVVFTLLGFVLSSAPWIAYFGIHHAITDLVNVYIKFNLFSYPSQFSIVGKLINSAILFGKVFNQNLEVKVMMVIGLVGFLLTRKFLLNKAQKYTFVSIIIFLILGVYYGGRSYPYYFLIIVPVSSFGLITIGYYIQFASEKGQKKFGELRWDVLITSALLSIVLCFGFNSNILSSKIFIERPTAQETFAKEIKKESHPTLLNYGFLDGGFYLAANVVPNVRYFEKQNIDPHIYPENMREQKRYVKERKIKFVVLRLPVSLQERSVHVPYLKKNYRLIKQQDQLVEGRLYRYLLYKIKTD